MPPFSYGTWQRRRGQEGGTRGEPVGGREILILRPDEGMLGRAYG